MGQIAKNHKSIVLKCLIFFFIDMNIGKDKLEKGDGILLRNWKLKRSFDTPVVDTHV